MTINEVNVPKGTKAKQLGITKFPYEEYDSMGKRTYFEDCCGSWFKFDFDLKGRLIYYESSSGMIFSKHYINNELKTFWHEDSKKQYINYKRNLTLNKLLNE